MVFKELFDSIVFCDSIWSISCWNDARLVNWTIKYDTIKKVIVFSKVSLGSFPRCLPSLVESSKPAIEGWRSAVDIDIIKSKSFLVTKLLLLLKLDGQVRYVCDDSLSNDHSVIKVWKCHQRSAAYQLLKHNDSVICCNICVRPKELYSKGCSECSLRRDV